MPHRQPTGAVGWGRTWVESLPSNLARHRVLLLDLLDAFECDPRWRWLELGCSVAGGRADIWSDLDLAAGVEEDSWPEALDDLVELLGRLGDVVDVLRHRLSEMADKPHQRIFVQYADGVQIDLVAVPAQLPKGTQPENVILHDPGGLRIETWDSSFLQPDAATACQWAFLGYVALLDVMKYLRRNSLWEARERLEQARTEVWRLWATGEELRYPVYGLTSVPDVAGVGKPPGIEATIASLDRVELFQAALACAALLDRTAGLAVAVVGGEVPGGIAGFVRRGLNDMARDINAAE